MSAYLRHCLLWLCCAALLSAGACNQPEEADCLAERISAAAIMRHLSELDRIAAEHDGSRASGTEGFDAALAYMKDQLEPYYDVSEQEFAFRYFKEAAVPELTVGAPGNKSYEPEVDFATALYCGSGQISDAVLVPVDLVMPPAAEPDTSDSGCQADDFLEGQMSLVHGRIALLQRGSCAYRVKAANAQAAGAVGVIIFNEGQDGRQALNPATLERDAEITIPVLAASYAVGKELYQWAQQDEVRLSLRVQVVNEERTTRNLLAEARQGDKDLVVMAGAHADSVENHGINDNGSGCAVLLEIALQMQAMGLRPAHRIRFAFWAAEEPGLIGSAQYVQQLSPAEHQAIRLYLNFDMLGSPNYGRFIYAAQEAASLDIQEVFAGYFQRQALAAETCHMAGRSDHAAFAAAGIPTGGLFAGDGSRKTSLQALRYGGEPDEPYDPCYHKACDNRTNINTQALEELGRAAAYAIASLAAGAVPDSADRLTPGARGVPTTVSSDEAIYQGPRIRR
jgi:Zn-dependent M28 family amino/carboxypeptidase